ncbi:MAG: hypothetical protein AAF654_09240 [Myxococcota bacterium]
MTDFDPREQRALNAWEVCPPTTGLTFAVLREVTHKRRRRAFVQATGVAVAVAAIVAVVLSPIRLPSDGEWQTRERETVVLAHRGIAVAEGGSSARWNVDFDGSARVFQKTGSVFYRVEPGGSFEVETPTGTIVATGTCFRVEVRMKKVLASAAAGIAIGAATVVTVYEGSVDVSGAVAGTRSLEAGEAVTLLNSGPAVAAEEHRRVEAPAASTVRVEGDTPTPLERFIALDRDAVPSRAQHVAAIREVERLRNRVSTLEEQLNERQEHGRKAYDIPDEELIRMADECEVTYDWNPPSDRPSTVSDETAEALELDTEQRHQIDRVFEETNARLAESLRELYVELTGDPNVGSLSFAAIMGEIADKTPRDEVQRVMQRLSSERAGLMVPPDDISSTSVYERYLRLAHGAGDQLQTDMGRAVGDDLAGRYRDHLGGYSSRSRVSNGCPAE